MSGDEEASELRRRLKDMTARLADVEASVFGCSACGGDHRGDLLVTTLRHVVTVKGMKSKRATICPETALVVFFCEGDEVASHD